YQQVVRTAFQEVMDSLSASQTSSDNFNDWKKNEQALDIIMKLTKQRYKHGSVAYLAVLNTEQNLLQTKINGVSITLKQLNAAVNLFQALGGDWDIVIEN